MRKRWVVLCVSVGLAAMTQVQAHDMRIEGDHCGYDSVYDVQVKSGGIDFSRSDARPADVFMHDGQLSVDGRAVAVSADDAARLRDYEAGMRELLPQMAGIAQEAVGIGFDSLAIVAATLGGSRHHRDALVDGLNQQRREALRELGAHMNAQRWDQQGLGRALEQPMTDAANALASSLTRHVLWSVLTGRTSDVEARADTVDQSVDKEMDARSGKLDARVKAVCPSLRALDQLQQQFRFRLADGSPLKLIVPEAGRDNPAVQLVTR